MDKNILMSSARLDNAADATEWVQRASVMLEQTMEITALLFAALKAKAPVLLEEGVIVGQLLAGVGVALVGLRNSAAGFMERNGIEPLELKAEMRRIARDTLAEEGVPEEVRAHLLELLAKGLDDDQTEEWAEFIMPGNGEMH